MPADGTTKRRLPEAVAGSKADRSANAAAGQAETGAADEVDGGDDGDDGGVTGGSDGQARSQRAARASHATSSLLAQGAHRPRRNRAQAAS